jgi:hypothetical protein
VHLIVFAKPLGIWIKKFFERELQYTDNNGIFDVNLPEQEVVQNATKGFVVMTQEGVSNKQTRTPPILSSIKWNKSKRKTPLTAKISSERDVLAFLVERFFLPNRKSFVNSSRLQLYGLKLRCITDYKRNGIVTAVIPSIKESVHIMIGVISTGRIMTDP